jgi:hypothetical protein
MHCLLGSWSQTESGYGVAPCPPAGLPPGTLAAPRAVAGVPGWHILPCLRYQRPRHRFLARCLHRLLLPSVSWCRLLSRNSLKQSRRSRSILHPLRLQRQQPSRPRRARAPVADRARRGPVVRAREAEAAKVSAGPAPAAAAGRLVLRSRGTWHSPSILRRRSFEAFHSA